VYSHVGRTVLVNEEMTRGLWVEGEDPGTCPLRELDPFVMLASNRVSGSVDEKYPSNN